MKSPTYLSTLADGLNKFVAFKHLENFKYEYGSKRLARFDRFLHQQSYMGPELSQEILSGYQASMASSGKKSRYKYMEVVRGFTLFYRQLYPESAVIVANPFKHHGPLKPYLYTSDDLASLMRAASALGPINTIRPHVFTTLIGLLYVTGMRISEALKLTIKDLHEEPFRLYISETKFGKDRLLPLRDSVVRALMAYRNTRKLFAQEEPDSPLFLNQKGTALSYDAARSIFHDLIGQCQIGSNWRGSSPRLHGLRHTFAVNTLVGFYRKGIDPATMLPFLVTYMGHRDLNSTSVYLHTTPELMDLASQRFHDYFYSDGPTEGGDNE